MVNLRDRELKPDYRDSDSSSEESDPENFKKLIAQIKSNWSGGNKKSGFKSGFLKQLKDLIEGQVGWLQTAAKCFVKEDETKAVRLSFKDLWSVTKKSTFLEDAILDTFLFYYFKNKNVG